MNCRLAQILYIDGYMSRRQRVQRIVIAIIPYTSVRRPQNLFLAPIVTHRLIFMWHAYQILNLIDDFMQSW